MEFRNETDAPQAGWIVTHEETALIFSAPFRGRTIRIDCSHKADQINLINAFSGNTTQEEAQAEYAILEELGILGHSAPSTIQDSPEFTRQIAFLDMLAEVGESGHSLDKRIAGASVCIIGIGGIGSCISTMLARAGVGNLVLVDNDIVEASNLNRQILYGRADIGKLKVIAAKSAIEVFSYRTSVQCVSERVYTQEQIERVIFQCSLAIVAIAYSRDFIMEPFWRNILAAGRAANCPILMLGQSFVGPTILPSRPSEFDRLAAEIQTLFPRLVASTMDEFGSFAPRLAMTSGLASWEAIKLLVSPDKCRTLDGIIAIDTISTNAFRQLNCLSQSRM